MGQKAAEQIKRDTSGRERPEARIHHSGFSVFWKEELEARDEMKRWQGCMISFDNLQSQNYPFPQQ
jgi:hypothetical protein